MGYSVLLTEVAHGINLVFHKSDERGDNYCSSVHDKGGELIAERLTSACRHKHKRIFTFQQITDYSLLVSLESIKAKMDFQYFLQIHIFCHTNIKYSSKFL